jgi:hypothetical protein
VSARASGRKRKLRWRWSYSRASLFDLIAGGLYHTTSSQGFRAIAATGAIIADPPVKAFPSTPGRECQAQRIRSIALFDMRSVSRVDAIAQEPNWAQFFFGSFGEPLGPVRVILRLELGEREAQLIANRTPDVVDLPDRPPIVPRWIPHVEAWHPGPIPLAAVSTVLTYHGDRRRGFALHEAGPSLVKRVTKHLEWIDRLPAPREHPLVAALRARGLPCRRADA